MKEALLWESLDNRAVRCGLCSHRCVIADGKTGLCNVRENRAGRLYSLVYGRAISANIDPIEKKPLFHFLPGSLSLSIATVGCNLKCDHCQNFEISQRPRDSHRIAGQDLAPEAVAAAAVSRGCDSISYTYTEPTVYFEYALDIARKASDADLKNVFVTNGFMTRDCLAMIGRDLHAANVDLKGFNDDFYKKVCGARLEPVKNTIAEMKAMGVWVEVTTLLIPGYNDRSDELKALAEWLAGVSPDIPWHISRFHPTYRLTDAEPTPAATIHRAMDIGRQAGLKYVYAGNIRGDAGEKTICPGCGRVLIDRVGFRVSRNEVENGACGACQTPIPGVWE